MITDPTSVGDFSKVAPYLTNPLVLIGFVLLLFFGIHRALIKSGILPPVSKTASGGIVRLLLHYGFIVALLLILFGFGLAAWSTYLKTKGKVLTRVEAENLLQKSRGSIELCLKDNPDILFLNFMFSYSEQGGINVDILGGREIRGTMLPHARLPGGIYDYKSLSKAVAEATKENPDLPPLGPPEKGDDQLTYFVPGNTVAEDPWAYHAAVFVAENGSKLSTSLPSVNGCIVDVVKDSINAYSMLPDNKPFLHRYITETGVERSSVRPSLLKQMEESPEDARMADQLATVYSNGVGGSKDLQSAYEWLLIEERLEEQDKSNEVSKAEIERVKKDAQSTASALSPTQVSVAQQHAQQWLKMHN